MTRTFQQRLGYFTPIAMHWLPFAEVSGAEGAVGYAIGLTAMMIVEGLLTAARRWKDDPKVHRDKTERKLMLPLGR